MRTPLAFATVLLLLGGGAVQAGPIAIVAAENFYGETARQVGGERVTVTSILTNPDQDPHSFEVNAAAARAISDARVVIYNGAGYDAWVAKLLAAAHSTSREAIEVAALLGKREGDNPHLWYAPDAAATLARALATTLARIDPEHRGEYEARLAATEQALRPLGERIATLRRRHAGTPVIATEPVFGYMADALGLQMRGARFQLAVMNDTEPSAGEIAAFEKALKTRAVKALIYNRQSGGALVERMLALAKAAGVPVVAVTETEPQGQTYLQWMLAQLDALDRALGGP